MDTLLFDVGIHSMIINGKSLLYATPIKNMLDHKEKLHGVSHGLSEAGYDIRIKQRVEFFPLFNNVKVIEEDGIFYDHGRFALASAIEEFHMPNDLVAVVHDKSSWARRALSVFNTVIEPGWKGFLTLELVYHGNKELIIPAGSGIAQVIFSRVENPAEYKGKYQNQDNRPVSAIMEKG